MDNNKDNCSFSEDKFRALVLGVSNTSFACGKHFGQSDEAGRYDELHAAANKADTDLIKYVLPFAAQVEQSQPPVPRVGGITLAKQFGYPEILPESALASQSQAAQPTIKTWKERLPKTSRDIVRAASEAMQAEITDLRAHLAGQSQAEEQLRAQAKLAGGEIGSVEDINRIWTAMPAGLCNEPFVKSLYRSAIAGAIVADSARQSQATKAQAEPSKIIITLRQALRLVDFFGGHDTSMTVMPPAADWEQQEPGLYAYCTEYPEDGCEYLGQTEVDDDLARFGVRGVQTRQAAMPAKTWKDAPYKLDHVAEAWARGWNEARATLVAPVAKEASAVPDILFDGFAVYAELTRHLGKQHCFSPDAVSATLDAVVRLIRRGASVAKAETGSVQALNGIPATMRHDEGAIARCFYCGRYSLDPAALSDRQPICECGKQHGWSGSFKRPDPDARWSGKAPDRAPTTSTVSAPSESAETQSAIVSDPAKVRAAIKAACQDGRIRDARRDLAEIDVHLTKSSAAPAVMLAAKRLRIFINGTERAEGAQKAPEEVRNQISDLEASRDGYKSQLEFLSGAQDEIKDQALEEAAKVAEDTDVATFTHAMMLHDDGSQTRSDIAKAIRALKRTTSTDTDGSAA